MQFSDADLAESKLEKPIKRVKKAEAKADKAQAKIPKKTVVKKERSFDPATGKAVSGAQMTILAFSSVFGEHARVIVSTSLALFAFSTILGWEYYGEKALEYLVSNHDILVAYRVIFSFITYIGATQTLDLVWDFSDTANGLMAIPNLICLLWLSKDIAKECFDYEDRVVVREKQGEKVDLSAEA